MAMAWIWTGMVAASVLYGICSGTIGAVGDAALEGAAAAVELCLRMAGVLCLWSGVMSIMKASGLMDGLSRLILIIGLSLNMLGITKLKVMNYVPAIFLPILLCYFM